MEETEVTLNDRKLYGTAEPEKTWELLWIEHLRSKKPEISPNIISVFQNIDHHYP